MKRLSKTTELWRVALIAGAGLFVGFLFGSPSWGLVIGLIAYIAYELRQLFILDHWIHDNLAEPPELTGMWEDLAFSIYRKRKRSNKRKKKLSQILRRFQESVDALPDAAVLLNQNYEIAWFNANAREMLGLKQGDIHCFIANLIRNPRFFHYLNSNHENRAIEVPSPVDESKTLDIRVIAYSTDQHLLLARDSTQLQRLMRMRQDFVANVSHELKTPLTVILGYLESVIDSLPPSEELVAKQLHKVEDASFRMRSIVDDLLVLSRLDTDSPLEASACPEIEVASLIRNVLEQSKQLSRGKHEFSLNLATDARLRGINLELFSVFMNLVSNAVRYTPDGGKIEIAWYLNNEEQAVFEVKDNGIGIAVDHIPRLTERFYRVDVGRSRASGGTGLGLAIVKQILRRHDAQLEVESKVGKGSYFRCIFPKARVQLSAPQKPMIRLVAPN